VVGRAFGGRSLETIYDWVTLGLFAGLIILFLQRSTAEKPSDHIHQYVPPAVGCAVVNYLGNNGWAHVATLGVVAILVYVWYVLKPLQA